MSVRSGEGRRGCTSWEQVHVIQEAAWDLLCTLRTFGNLPDRMLAEFAMELSELLASSRGLTLHDVRSARMRARLVAEELLRDLPPDLRRRFESHRFFDEGRRPLSGAD